MAAKFKRGDRVVVIAGKDKGRTGEISRVLPAERRVFVEGVNLVKRHTRPSMQSQGGIVTKEASLDISNIAHADPKDGSATRVGFKTLDDGRKVRFAKRSGEIIDS